MNKDRPQILPNTRSKLAAMYGVNISTFNGWIDINDELKNLLAPYLNAKKRSFPPDVVKRIVNILGEP